MTNIDLAMKALVDVKCEQSNLENDVQTLLGYPDGTVLECVTRYHAYATHEIATLKGLNKAAVEAVEKLTQPAT